MAYNVSFTHVYSSLATGNSYSVTRKQSKEVTSEQSQKRAALAKDLRDRCRTLFKADFSSGASTNIMTKLAKFVDSYNELVKDNEGSKDKSINRQLESMNKLIMDNKSALAKAGIDYDEGKLKINSETLSKLKSSSKFKELFTGNSSFISKMNKYANKLYKSFNSQTSTLEVPTYENISVNDTIRTVALDAGKTLSDIKALTTADYSSNGLTAIAAMLKNFTANYNNLKTGLDNSSDLSEKTADYRNSIYSLNNNTKDQLMSIGLETAYDGTLSLNDMTFNSTDIDNVKNLFASGNAYSNELIKQLGGLFSELSGASANGLSVNVSV